MAFLTKSELNTVADTAIIDKITLTDDTIVADIINQSIALMSSYLKPRYDTEAIFAATGTDRHLTVLKYLKDIVIYEIYIRHTRSLNEVAYQRYNDAIRWLEKINRNLFSADLPIAVYDTEDELNTVTAVSTGSNTRYNSNF